MAELRCPMCSTLNEDTAEVCSECAARLTPLVLNDPEFTPQTFDADEGTPEPSPDAGAGDDWLDRIRSGIGKSEDPEDVEERLVSPPAVDAETPAWLGDLREASSDEDEGPPAGEIPGWMDEFMAAGDADAEVGEGEEVPEWLSRIRARQADGETPEEAQADDAWLNRLREEEGIEEVGSNQSAREGLEDLEPSPEYEDEPKTNPFSTPVDLGPLSDLPGVPGSPDRALRRSEVMRAQAEMADQDETPSPVEELSEDLMPHVPALVKGGRTENPVIEIDQRSLDSVELPDWLSELKPDIQLPGPGDNDSDLAPATLPSWLEAMRPVDGFRPEIEIEPDDMQAVESAGPLAGLRGVLMAEPVVAMPRNSSAVSGQLEITERQYAQAELLHRLVEEEEGDIPLPGAAGRRFPITRWVISLIILIALVLPGSSERLGFLGFSLPTVVPREMEPLIGLVESIPNDRPALVVFDFTPGYSGELDTVAGVIIKHILNRSVPIVTVSTRPSGPPLAERLLREVSADTPLINGAHYLHLGYLSGGPTAVQLFAISPRDALLTGFLLPAGFDRASVWQSPLVSDVRRLSDFGAVVVITAGTDTARHWAEQTHPWIGETPLIMVLSAGAEPLVRPYYEATDQRVQGILTGLPSALAYQQMNGQPLTVQSRWNGFGSMMFAVESILIVGGVYGAVTWFLNRRQQRKGQQDA
ncbi:MAG: hypothetical protein E4G99_07060 [Anaerolineales bacterium]|nr:MAG: hypothetical protein E4G99_07060 [Anaerolineales bacterium]